MTAAHKLRPRGLSVLGSIALLLAVSAALRLGSMADMAHASGDNDAAGPHDAVTTGPDPAETPPLLEAFRQREERVSAREALLATREEALALASAEIEERLAALSQAEESLAAMIALAENAATDDLMRLTAVYENMRPQDAAALFERMDASFGAGFLGMMDPAAAAAIMGRLTPETAYSVSAVLAGRNVSAPRD